MQEFTKADVTSIKSTSAEVGENPVIVECKPALHSLTDWDGPDDVGNPRNWSFRKKLYATVIPALYAFVVYDVLQVAIIFSDLL